MITVKKDVSATITLKGVSIETANANTVQMSCIELEEGADVTLVLSGKNNLYTVSNSGAAIHVPEGSSLTIRAGSDQATLYAFARAYGAGIGGNSGEGHGKITIESGTVAACSGMRLTENGPENGTVSDSGAGIGSGSQMELAAAGSYDRWWFVLCGGICRCRNRRRIEGNIGTDCDLRR